MGGSKVIQVANTQVGERQDEAICVILCIEYALHYSLLTLWVP